MTSVQCSKTENIYFLLFRKLLSFVPFRFESLDQVEWRQSTLKINWSGWSGEQRRGEWGLHSHTQTFHKKKKAPGANSTAQNKEQSPLFEVWHSNPHTRTHTHTHPKDALLQEILTKQQAAGVLLFVFD